MDTFDRESLDRLAGNQGGPCVSLYMPTHLPGKDSEQDAIRHRNLLHQAERMLAESWIDENLAGEFLAKANGLSSDTKFWDRRQKGLAIFVSPVTFEAYRTSIPLVEQVTVANRFRVRPILPLLEHDISFLLLSLSQNQVALYAVDEQSIDELEVPNIPLNLNESLNYVASDRGSQVHAAMRGNHGKQAGVFHGQGGKPDSSQEDLLAFFGIVDKAITGYLGNSTRPMMLACVASHAPLYRKKNSYKHLMSECLTGNHEHDNKQDLHQRAWEIGKRLLTTEADMIAARYADRSGTTKVSDEASTIIPSAIAGRVEALLYDPKAQLFGRYDASAENLVLTGEAGDEDLIDIAAIETVRHGGSIHVLTDQDIPTNAPMAAIFRY